MPFARPSLEDLIARIQQDFAARLPGADTTLRRSNIVVSAKVIGNTISEQYGYLYWLANQLFADTAEVGYLERIGRIVGITRKPGSGSAGNAILAGSVGVPVPSGTALQTSDQAAQFVTTADATIGADGTVTVPIVSAAGSTGAATNLAAGAVLQLVTAIAGIAVNATVDAAGLSGGADAELDPALRGRVLFRLQNPPQGGAAADYIGWAKQVDGVTRAWVYPRNRGAGTVDLTVVYDGRAPGSILPLAADLSAVQSYIENLRPVTADVGVFACAAAPQNVTISGLALRSGYAGAVVQANIAAALAALFATATPGAALYGDGVSASAPGGTLYREQVDQAIANAAGVAHYGLTAPAADIVVPQGQIPTLGVVSYT